MVNGNKNNIDDLLKNTLSKSDKPSLDLNYNLKMELRKTKINRKEISFWWVPIVCELAVSLIILLGSYLFIGDILVKTIIITFTVLSSISVIILTVVGLKYFELKERGVLV